MILKSTDTWWTRRGLVCSGLFLRVALLAAGGVTTGAAVQREALPVVLHVNQGDPSARDSNAGTATAPLRSIGEAVRRALANYRVGTSSRVLVHPGTYRESLALDGPAEATGASIVIEGTGDGEAIVSGSDRWHQWLRDREGGLFHRSWTFEWHPPSLPEGWDQVRADVERNPILLHGEMIFVNGRRLEQAFSALEMRGRPWTFYVQAADARHAGTVWVHAADDLTREGEAVEVSVRPALLTARRMQHLTLRRLVFQHASSQLQDAAVRLDRSSDVRVDECRFVQNSWIGLGVYQSTDVTLSQVHASENGAGGIQAWRVRGLTLTDTNASYNNWRGASGGFTGWATGQKFVSIHGARFTRYTAVGNQATGLWFDTDNADVVVENAVIRANRTRGVFLEASQGPFVIADSRISDNGEIGLMATGAARVTLRHDAITGNAQHQIFLPWLVRAHAESTAVDFETGRSLAIRSEQWTLVDSVIAGGAKSLLFSVGRWPWFFGTLHSDHNEWKHAGGAKAFAVYAGRGRSPTRLDFDGWRRVSGQDASSVFAYP